MEHISEIKKIIFSTINRKRRTPKTLIKTGEKIYEILYDNNLVFNSLDEKNNKIPFMLIDGEAIILDQSSVQVQSLFSCHFGLDLFHNRFGKELFNFIKNKTIISSDTKILHKYTCIVNNKFYISCGKNSFVTIDESKEELIKQLNGTNDIIFNSEYIIPDWDINNDPYNKIFPFDQLKDYAKAFDINVSIPDGANIYTKEMQSSVLTDWVIAALMKVKPLPILLFYGEKSSGKTLTSKAIMKLFMGNNSNVSIFPNDKRSLMSCITNNFIYTIDNLDSKTLPWFNDTLTLTSTGGELSERALFSNSTTFKKEILSSVIITSRNPQFANREDIKDRVLPIFFENRSDYSIPEDVLLDEVSVSRGPLLSRIYFEVRRLINEKYTEKLFLQKYRFTKFGQILENRSIKLKRNYSIKSLLSAVVNSQFYSLTDIDPLIQEILEFDFKSYGIKSIDGTPSEIIKILESCTKYTNTSKPRVISRKLKENFEVFRINNWEVDTEKYGNTTKFKLTPPISDNLTDI